MSGGRAKYPRAGARRAAGVAIPRGERWAPVDESQEQRHDHQHLRHQPGRVSAGTGAGAAPPRSQEVLSELARERPSVPTGIPPWT